MPIDLRRALEVADNEIGYRESGNNHQKYSPAVPGLEWSQNQPWCATFTCWVFLQAGGKPGEDFPLTASCAQQVAWGKQRGRFYSSPRVGDLALFGPNGATHVEIVVAVNGGQITTIGGNTSGSWGGTYWNGDGVYKKTRSASSVYGFVRPVYGTSGSGDDMPEFTYSTAGAGQVLKPREWTTLVFSAKRGRAAEHRAVVSGPASYVLSASVTLEGADLPNGTEVHMRVAHYRTERTPLPSGILRHGDSGPEVRQLQTALRELGYSLGAWGVDGDYGNATRDAVRAVQRDAGFTGSDLDGVYGPMTRDAMRKRLPSKTTKAFDAPVSPTVHAGGNCHAVAHLAERVKDGDHVRVRVCHYGPEPVRVLAAKCTAHVWEG